MIIGWAVPLFLAVLIVLIFTPTSGALKPAFCSRSPDQTLRIVRIAIVAGNVACLGLSLVATQVIGNPYAWPHEKYPGVPAWVDVFATLVGRAGMPAFWNMGWSLVTAMRYPALAPIQSALGLAYEHSVAIHRTLGWMTTFWLVVHGFGYMFVYLMQGILSDAMQPGSHGSWFNFFALLGLICLLVLAITSHFRIRRPAYPVFAMFHWLWIPFMIFSILHITSYFMVLVPPLFLYIIDRLACLFGTHMGAFGGSTITVTAVRISDESFALLIPVGPIACNTFDQDKLDAQLAQMYTPGRFMCLASATEAPGVFPSHPFSIAAYSVPNRTVVIMVRALGPWTKQVHAQATAQGAPIRLRISGPYSVSAVAHRDGASTQVLVAGGIGISKYLGAGNSEVMQADNDVKAPNSSSSSDSSGRGSTKVSTPPSSVSTATDSARADSIAVEGDPAKPTKRRGFGCAKTRPSLPITWLLVPISRAGKRIPARDSGTQRPRVCCDRIHCTISSLRLLRFPKQRALLYTSCTSPSTLPCTSSPAQYSRVRTTRVVRKRQPSSCGCGVKVGRMPWFLSLQSSLACPSSCSW
ncbi:hypothetical protein BCR44DRAFT_1483970 [Catenaria anguillulae PL171]|uniref:FAD-binding FR-type domain-containing protein n=1 Tax=Catenaria anguillulae PL171 TaxID=765915 RepID=A0A1Y2HSB8_9FUNG|nr:hypothetical protein BCR44DRAFT_1483970 [Catenaria anguillulae PL171]